MKSLRQQATKPQDNYKTVAKEI